MDNFATLPTEKQIKALETLFSSLSEEGFLPAGLNQYYPHFEDGVPHEAHMFYLRDDFSGVRKKHTYSFDAKTNVFKSTEHFNVSAVPCFHQDISALLEAALDHFFDYFGEDDADKLRLLQDSKEELVQATVCGETNPASLLRRRTEEESSPENGFAPAVSLI